MIEKIELTNFKGIRGHLEFDMPHILALCGKNGMGKTTILNAIRYGLTGSKPEGDIIYKGCGWSKVAITLHDSEEDCDIEFSREEYVDKPNKCRINGKATTMKAMNEKIQDVIKIPLDKVDILSSSDIVASMEPQEFAKFILDYIPEKMDVTDVLATIPSSTIGMMEIVEAALPETGIEMSDIDAFLISCKNERKEQKQLYATKKLRFESLPESAPEESMEEIKEALADLIKLDAKYDVYLAKKSLYDKSIDAIKKNEVATKDLEAKIASITVSRPNPAVLKAKEEEAQELSISINNQKVVMASIRNNVEQLSQTLKALEEPICPVSPLIRCHEDKTVAKEEIKESIDSSMEGLRLMEEELTKTEGKLENINMCIEEERSRIKQYNEKIALQKSLKALQDSKPEAVEKPEEIEKPDTEKLRFQLERKLKLAEQAEEKVKLEKQMKLLEEHIADLERLVKAFSEKGEVRTAITAKYIGVFEDVMNERTKLVRPEVQFKLDTKNGIVPMMTTGKGYLPYCSLSGGEKAYMIFIIMDMLNQLSGTRMLFLDELSVIDDVCFDSLLDIVMAYSSEYDHIIIAAVDHSDTVDSLNNHGIPIYSHLKEVDLDEDEEENKVVAALSA